MCSKQPDSMSNTDADAPGAFVTDAGAADAASAENEAAQSALPASFSRYE